MTPGQVASFRAACAEYGSDEEKRRAKWIADARALIDLLEANPALPLGTLRIAVHPRTGADLTDREVVDNAAALLGIEAVTTPPRNHHTATLHIGRAEYGVVHVPTAAMDRHHEVFRLGEAALAEQEAARLERDYETHEANEAWLDAHPDEFVNDEDGAL